MDEALSSAPTKFVDAAQRVVVRQQQNNSLPGAESLRDDVLHRDVALRRGRMKIILIHFAAVGFQLLDDVFLRTMQPFGSGRARAEADQFRHVLVSFRAIEPAGLVGGRRDLRQSWSCDRLTGRPCSRRSGT